MTTMIEKKVTAASYGYRVTMTTSELHALLETLNHAQCTELGRLIYFEAEADRIEAEELLAFRDAKFGPQAANT